MISSILGSPRKYPFCEGPASVPRLRSDGNQRQSDAVPFRIRKKILKRDRRTREGEGNERKGKALEDMIGLDILHLPRIHSLLSRRSGAYSQRFINRILHPNESKYLPQDPVSLTRFLGTRYLAIVAIVYF